MIMAAPGKQGGGGGGGGGGGVTVDVEMHEEMEKERRDQGSSRYVREEGEGEK